MDWFSLFLPFAYLTILLTSLATFSSLYRKRKTLSRESLAPYFPPHVQRNIYLSLLHLPEVDPSAPKVPESVLRAALLARAVEDINRIMNIRTRKQALSTLLARGVVGDEIWQRLLRAEQEIEIEVKDVVQEANALGNGTWGQTIFQSASEMANGAILKERLANIRKTVEPEKEWWAQKREASRRELEGQSVADTTATAPAVATATAPPDKTPKAGSSDEDAVLVETPVDGNVEVAGITGGGGKNKKKKGKK